MADPRNEIRLAVINMLHENAASSEEGSARGGHRVLAHAVACDAASSVGGAGEAIE